MLQKPIIPKKHQPKGIDILYEDRDIIVGNKKAGFLTVTAAWNKDKTVHQALNHYIRKGSLRSRKCVYVVHRLDQDTSGVIIFAKTEQAQAFLKDNWKSTVKIYHTIVHGNFSVKKGIISSYLSEDEDYVVHSSKDRRKGELAKTAYEVIQETPQFSLLKINLLTGKKNQIRVHMADKGHPVVGDAKYGKKDDGFKNLALHAQSISFTHPFSRKRLTIEAEKPFYFNALIQPLDKKTA